MTSLAGRSAALFAIVLALLMFGGTAWSQTEESSLKWPREMESDKGLIVVYQPQLEDYSGQDLEARIAVAVTPTGEKSPVFGACWFQARLATDMDERLVSLEGLEVTAAKFPDVDAEKVEALTGYLEAEMPQWELTIDLDRLLASMEAIGLEARGEGELSMEPPEIIHVDHPAVLVLIEGDPILTELEGTDLEIVVNTAYFIVKEKKDYSLKGGENWYTASDLMGPWKITNNLSKSVQEVAKKIEEEEKQQEAEAPIEEDEDLGASEPPEIIVRTAPAEIVQTHGTPEMAAINGTELLYVSNTESDVLLHIPTQTYYVLLSGRWFTSDSLSGNEWTYVSQDALPEDFAKIPPDSDMGQVLYSVAGTQEAKETVLENQIPQTAEVDRKTATVTVTYDGAPEFEKCTDVVAYGKNTDKAVLLIDGTYYCCDEAIWFVAKGPNGPWEVATAVPEEVQDIPPECPVHNVKYVYIYDSTPEVVYVGYTPAYSGSYVYGGCVVYGTGYWYDPWWRGYYYARPATWGYRVHWNPVTGWGFSFGASVGWLHIGFGRPWYGGWWGPRGYRWGYRHGYRRGYRHGYHRGHRAGYRAGYRSGQRAGSRSNLYASRSQGVRSTGGKAAVGRAGGAGRSPATAQKKQPNASNKKNNVYADKNGNVYRNQQGKGWEKNNGKQGWSSNDNASKNQNLNKDQRARSQGSNRAQQSRSTRPRGGGGGGRRR